LTFKKLGFPPTNSFQKVFGEIKQQQKTPKSIKVRKKKVIFLLRIFSGYSTTGSKNKGQQS